MKKVKSVLIVDDSSVDTFILTRLLKKVKWPGNILKKYDGEEGINYILEYLAEYRLHGAKDGEEYPTLLVFLDLNMPEMNGYEFLDAYEKITKSNDPKIIDIIVYTTSSKIDDVMNVMKYENVIDYIIKPLNYEKLGMILEKYDIN